MPLLGFLGKPAPSRKQWEWYRDRQGPLKKLENPITTAFSTDFDTSIGTTTTTVYTVPQNQRARLLWIQILVTDTTVTDPFELLIDGARYYYWLRTYAPGEVSFRFTIDDGPQFFSTIAIRYTATAARTPGFRVSGAVNREPAADGEYISV